MLHSRQSFGQLPSTGEAVADEVQSPSRLPSNWLFQAATEAMLIARAGSGEIIEANPLAAAVLGTSCGALVGSKLPSAFARSANETIEACVDVAMSIGDSETRTVRAPAGSVDLHVRFSLLRAPQESYLLVRLAEFRATAAPHGAAAPESPAFRLIDRAPVGFLMTDSSFRIEYANRVFAKMVGLRNQAEARGQSLTRWVRLTEADLARLYAQLSQRLASTIVRTQLRTQRRRSTGIEVCAVAVPEGHDSCWGFSISELALIN